MSKALDLGYRWRWAWVALWAVGAVVMLGWLFEPFEGDWEWWLPNGIARALLWVSGRGLDGVLGIQTYAFMPGSSFWKGQILCIAVYLGGLALAALAFLPLRHRTATTLPARRRPTWRAVFSAALMAGLLTAGSATLVIDMRSHQWHHVWQMYWQWADSRFPQLWASGVPRWRWKCVMQAPALVLVVLGWLLWAGVFAVSWRRRERYWQFERMTRFLMLAAAGLLAVVLLADLVWRWGPVSPDRFHDYEDGGGAYTALVLAGTVLFWAWTCRVALLFMLPRYQRGKAEPVCLACEYDLRGTLAAGRTHCPECGAEIDAALRTSPPLASSVPGSEKG